ncbi:MAG: Glu-tRNA(Gln) amidotransferase subunit GatE [Nanoarchaeota archaeon]|nr:Glu-tRNA(Gln) amidotransferase subunit GatE [Nanoarchaeota archaeon]
MNYENLGLRIGLEVHQRLETHKLFCKCPSILREDKPDIIIKRKIRAVAGETGEIDIAAKHEMEKNLEFIYEAYSDTTCNVELDEEPPGPLNMDSLGIALQISKLLNAKAVDEVHFMRKTVVDGSNTTGFQRTALIAQDGYINTSLGNVRIGFVCLEEEAAKNVKEEKDSRIWRLDRLGIPLIEIQTQADIKTPEHAKEVAQILGMILRSTGRAMRGIGSIRQDINLSIQGGARVEIKGFQDLRTIPKVITKEIERQKDLIEQRLKVKPEVRKAEPEGTTSFMRPMPGAARMYPETDVLPVRITKRWLDLIEIPELLTEKAIKVEKQFGLNADMAREVIQEGIELEDYSKKYYNLKPSMIAQILIETPKEIKARLKLDVEKIRKEDYAEVLEALNTNKISKEAVIELLSEAAQGKSMNFGKYKQVSIEDLEAFIKDLAEKSKGISLGGLMGDIRKKFGAAIDGKQAMELLKKYYKEN